MTADYCTAGMVKAVMPDVSWGTSYDTLLTTMCSRASRYIDRICGRAPGSFATGTAGTARYFDGSGTAIQWVDCMAAIPSEVAVDEVGEGTYTVWSSSDYQLWPYNSTPYMRLEINVLASTRSIWPKMPRSVRITAPWGYSVTPPDDLVQAAITQVVRWFKRGQQGFQDVGAVSELGQLRYVTKLDPDIEGILYAGDYVNQSWLV